MCRTKPHQAHATHSLWQTGKSIKCKACGLQSHLDAEDRVILTKESAKSAVGPRKAFLRWRSFSPVKHSSNSLRMLPPHPPQPRPRHHLRPLLTEPATPLAPRKLKFTEATTGEAMITLPNPKTSTPATQPSPKEDAEAAVSFQPQAQCPVPDGNGS